MVLHIPMSILNKFYKQFRLEMEGQNDNIESMIFIFDS